jgi:hypothetical protein
MVGALLTDTSPAELHSIFSHVGWKLPPLKTEQLDEGGFGPGFQNLEVGQRQ